MFDIGEIERFIERCNQAANDTELRSIFQTFNVQFDLAVPSDPFSEQYSQKQMALYEQLAGKPYSPANEATDFDVSIAAKSPFPYSNRSCELVGNHLMAIGFLIKKLALPMGSQVLELGPGWGNLTVALAKTGMAVTAVDVESRFCELIRERAKHEGVSIDVVNTDFSYLQTVEAKFDAIVFFESFHHASDHRGLMAAFDHALKPGGLVCFGSEPIADNFPIPWGLRMDGESLWAIRRNGWLELGFNEKYFEEALLRAGWYVTWSRDCPSAAIALARRVKEAGGVYTTHAGKLATSIGKRNKSGGFVAEGDSGFLVFGPYIELPRGNYRAVFSIDSAAPTCGTVDLDISVNFGTEVLTSRRLDLSQSIPMTFEIDFSLAQQVKGLEARINCMAGSHLTVTELRISTR